MISLHSDESILIERRQFWLPIAIEGVSALFFAIVPFGILLFAEMLPGSMRNIVAQYQLPYLYFSVLWFLIGWISFSIRWTDYYLDVLVVTNKRIIDIQQIGLFSRDISELRFENIEDIRVEIAGFLPSLLNFGNLYIQTAGEAREFAARNIPDPNGIREMISRQHDSVQKKLSPAQDK